MRDRLDLFVVSVLVLFLELTCIRWFPSHVLFLTFFTNIVLLACFLGISLGCLSAGHKTNYLTWSPLLIGLALGVARWIDYEREHTGAVVDLGHQVSPQLVYFGAEYQPLGDPSRFVIPIEAVSGILFVLIALAMLGPGQQLGRSISRIANRIEGYTVNIAGSIVGILLFTLCAWQQLGPVWWFGIVLAAIVYFLSPEHRWRGLVLAAAPVAILMFASADTATLAGQDRGGNSQFWSPDDRIDYNAPNSVITVNLIGHQQMITREAFSPAYSLPHLLNRDAGRGPFSQVMVIGAGSGNDVSRALAWGAQRVDAVEIDPVIQSLGAKLHPDRPYSDPRVIVHLNDGRNYLRSTNKKYDLIVYALVDSLVLHSSYSNIRLESYLFTTEAFADIKARLAPGGVFVMYNYFRQGWIVSRLNTMLQETFGDGNPIVFNLPARDKVEPDDVMAGDFTVFMAGATGPIRQAFARDPGYWIPADRPTNQTTPNGFAAPRGQEGWLQFRPTNVVAPKEALRLATDSWPFLYLQRPMIPELNIRGMAIMGGLGLLMLAPFFLRARAPLYAAGRAAGLTSSLSFLGQMFFLGAGFMLMETKAVVHMALLFGSTWIVNSVVFLAVLVMILVANLVVLMFRPKAVAPFYVALLLALAVNAVVPMDAFLGLSHTVQITAACLLAFTPIFFAGIVFAVSFSRAADPDRALGANAAGALMGGLSEYSSMLLGFQYVVVVALAFYAASWLAARASSAKQVVSSTA